MSVNKGTPMSVDGDETKRTRRTTEIAPVRR